MSRTFITIQLAIALIALPTAALFWYMFVRPVPTRTAPGAITSKTFLDATTVTRYPSNIFRQTWTPTQIRMNEAYVFGVTVENQGEAHFALDTLSSRDYAVGQAIEVDYEERGLPPLWTLLRVTGVRASRAK